MTARVRRLPYLFLMAAIFCVGPGSFPAAAQNAKAANAKDRVAKRYAAPAAGTAAAGATAGVEDKIQKIPLPDFVKSSRDARKKSGPDLAPPADGQAYDMEKSAQRGLDANPQMQSVRASASGAEEARRQALANFGPVGTVSYSVNRYDGQINTGTSPYYPRSGYWQNINQLQLQATQPLFTGFNLLSSYQKAALTKDQAKANIRYSEITLVKSVQKAFLGLLQARSNVRSNKDSVARLESQYKVAQAYYDVGLKPRLDVLQAESDLATAEQNLLKAENNVKVQTTQLNSLLNLPLQQNTNYVGELTYLPFTMSIKDCLDAAYKQRPDLYMGVKAVQIAEKDVKIAASPLYPQVQAQATYSKQGNQLDLGVRDVTSRTTPEMTTVGITASLRAWDWGSTFFGMQAARKTVKKLQADLAEMRLNVGYEVKTYYLNLQDAAKRISVARTALEATKEGYRMAVARYQAQVGTSTDVLDAQSRVSSAEFNLTQALTDYQSALADLYAGMGMKNLSLMP